MTRGTAQTKIRSTPLCEDVISPLTYGNFMEFIDSHIRGMWAERGKNRSFEDGHPQKLSNLCYFNDVTDKPWRAWGKTTNFDSTCAGRSMDPKEISKYWIDKAVHDCVVHWAP